MIPCYKARCTSIWDICNAYGLIANAVVAQTRPTPQSTLRRRPCRYLLMPERAPLALWATPAHASLMASMTTDGVLAVYDDGAGLREQTLKVSATSLEVMGTGSRSKDALTGMW